MARPQRPGLIERAYSALRRRLGAADIGIPAPQSGLLPGTYPVKAVDPRKEYMAGGEGVFPLSAAQVLSRNTDDLTRDFGASVYEAMLADPAVVQAFHFLKLAVLAGDLQVQPPKQFRPEPGSDPDEHDDPAGVKLAEEVADFWTRSLCRPGLALKHSLWEWMDGLVGSKLSELTWEVCEYGPDAGKQCLESMRGKASISWAFVVDVHGRTLGILGYTAVTDAAGQYVVGPYVMPPEKFAVIGWNVRNSDPRGRSILRAAYTAWNHKLRLWPDYYKFLYRNASPAIAGEAAPNGDTTQVDAPVGQTNPVTGTPYVAGDVITQSEAFFVQLMNTYRNGGVIVYPNEGDVKLLEATGEGGTFLNAFSFFNAEIAKAILLEADTAHEAKNDSKAKSTTGQDVVGNLVQYLKGWLCTGFRDQVLRRGTELNWGPEVAHRMTPEVTLGGTEHQDRSALWTAAGSIGYATQPDQWPGMDAELGVPIRKPAPPGMEPIIPGHRDPKEQNPDGSPRKPEPAPGQPGQPGAKPAPGKPDGKGKGPGAE